MITQLVHTVGAADLSALLTIKSLVAFLMYVDNHKKINNISLHVVTKTEKEGGVEKPNSKVEKQQQSSKKTWAMLGANVELHTIWEICLNKKVA